MRTRLLIVLALGALLAGLPAAAQGSAAHHASNSKTFPDSVGEDPSAPDITSIVVSNDDAGLITFQINVSNRPTFTDDMFFLIYIDADQNQSTGAPGFGGTDDIIELDPGSVALFQWNGSNFVLAPSQESVTYTYQSTGPTIRVSAADLGRTKGISFGVVAASGYTTDASGNPDFSQVHRDYAPDAGQSLYSYQVLTKLVLTATAFTTSPRPAKAGGPFAASMAVNENDTNEPVRSGSVSCAASLGGKIVAPVTHVLTNGIATCIWRIPKTAKGMRIRGTVTVTVEGTQLTRTFSVKLA